MSRRIIITESELCQGCGSRGIVSCRTFPCEHGGHPCESCTGRGVLEHSLTAPSPGMVERAAEAAIEAFCVTIGLSSDWIATTEDQRTRWRHIGGAAVTAALFPDMDIASLGLPDLTAPESDAYYKEMSETGTGQALTIDELRVRDGYHSTRPATLADLTEVLESLGAERVESHWAYDYEGEQTVLFVDEPGSYIVWRIEGKK